MKRTGLYFQDRLGAIVAIVALAISMAPARAADPPAAHRVLLLGGSSGSHRPAEMVRLLAPALVGRNIAVTYTEQVDDFNAENLNRYDCVAIYKDDGQLPEAAEAALTAYVEGGHGLVAIHCASHAFRNSPRYGALVGGRFASHGRETFRARILDAQHPAMREVRSFETDDETYVHNELVNDLRVLMGREDAGRYEPYAWVREQGRGRVYYTALGHDEQTWAQPGFHGLIEQAVRWAAGELSDDAPANPVVDDRPGPLAPVDSMRHMHLHEGFHVELFAAEPEIVKPLTTTFDERGRLWVVESVDYPNDVFEPYAGHDRIKICEDTDGDGRADRFTVFADRLNIPTSIQVVHGGALVALAPHIVYFQDTDGDDVADRHTEIITGFGKFDTHAVHSNFQWGPDNWIWATVGYSGGRIGDAEPFKQSLLRFRTDGTALEILTPTSNNTWGLGFDARGIPFASTANNQHAVHLAIPNRYLERVRGLKAIGSAGIEDHKQFHHIGSDLRQVDFHGGYTAAAGFTWLTSDSVPEHLRNRAALVCEPTGHLVHIDFVVPHGAGFVARDGFNLLASDDPWTAPIETHLGPDGAIWMVDWYNYIVRHNPTPVGFETGPGNAYITPERDKAHGRIYRLVPDGASPITTPRLAEADETELVAALAHGNSWVRQQARRLLVERGRRDAAESDRVGEQLLRVAATELIPAVQVIESLWAIDGLDRFDLSAAYRRLDQASQHSVAALIDHDDAGVRRAAVNCLGRRIEGVFAGRLAALPVQDADAQVRLAALLALADHPQPGSGAAIVAVLADANSAQDHWLALAATSAAAMQPEEFLIAALARQLEPEACQVVRKVAEHAARQTFDAATARRIIAAAKDAPAAVGEAVWSGLAAGWPESAELSLSDEEQQALAEIYARASTAGQLALSELAGPWKLGDRFRQAALRMRDVGLTELAAAETTLERRLELVAQLGRMSTGVDDADLEALAALLDRVGPQSPPELTKAVFDALADARHSGLGKLVAQRWSHWTPAARGAAVSLLLRRSAWTSALLDAIDERSIDPGDLTLDLVQQLTSHPNAKLAQRAKALLAERGASDANREAILQALLPLAERSGDAARGRAVFEQNCAKCHRLGALGQAVGPDLTGIAVRTKAAILTEILDPNRSVEGNFRQYTVTTSDGQVFSGLLLSETRTAVELLDSQAQRHAILREDIDELLGSARSVMPEGFEKLPPDDLVSLLEFLGQRGEYVPLSLAKAATIVSTQGMFYSREATVERLVFDAWGPQTFAGVPFQLLDPRGGTARNAIVLQGKQGPVSATLPRSATVECGLPAKAVHLLGGVAGWAWPLGQKSSVSLVVRLQYADGEIEDHALRNGEHIADYIRHVDVPGSQLAFLLHERQLRYLSIVPRRTAKIAQIEFVKGDDDTAPIVMAVTVQTPTGNSPE
ncbi:MAG: ThuA domain-containing protein [Pirellulales bacterium]|nr:ThuA domain-containing protein [Pirellulales bacterium]